VENRTAKGGVKGKKGGPEGGVFLYFETKKRKLGVRPSKTETVPENVRDGIEKKGFPCCGRTQVNSRFKFILALYWGEERV